MFLYDLDGDGGVGEGDGGEGGGEGGGGEGEDISPILVLYWSYIGLILVLYLPIC